MNKLTIELKNSIKADIAKTKEVVLKFGKKRTKEKEIIVINRRTPVACK